MKTVQPPRAAIETLGCKVNQYESLHFLELLVNAGFQIVSFRDKADLYLVHSCAVTSRAAYQTRQLLRRAQRLNPGALHIVAGCDAQLEPHRFATENLATHVLGTEEKYDLLDFVRTPASLSKPLISVGGPRQCNVFRDLPVRDIMTGRARAFLKVQDGCDAFCSYCVVPHTRGRSRSLPAGEVRNQMDRFLRCGFNEVILTGIHLGQWGGDLEPAHGLPELLAFLDEGPLPPRIRLSSIEPMEFTTQLLHSLRSHPWVCPHFHVPLQSGDAEILRSMGRPYSPQKYAEVILELHQLFPAAALGADVMVGFPGEREKHFQNTCALIESLPLTYLHVFPFSPRTGTPAAQWPNRVEGPELKRRARHLQQMGLGKKQAFERRFVGQYLRVLVENRLSEGWWQGTSDNYLRVRFVSSRTLTPGLLANVRCAETDAKGLVGKSASSSAERVF